MQANSTTGVAIDHNLWFLAGVDDPSLWGAKVYAHAAWSAATAQGSGDVFGDPQLAGAWALPIANLQPTASSPAVDKDAVLAEVTTDFAGAPRPVGVASHEIDQDPCEHALATGTWVGYNPAQRLPAMPSILVSV